MPDEVIAFTLPKIPTTLDNDNVERKKEIKEQEDKEINDETDLQRLCNEIHLQKRHTPSELEFYFGGPNRNFFLISFGLNLIRDNLDFIDFLSSDIGSQFFKESMLSIHSETGNIFYSNYNTGKSIYDFLPRQQDDTKKIIHAALTYTDSFSSFIKCFLDDIDAETVDKFDFLSTKVLNIFYTDSKIICYLEVHQLPQ